MGITIYCMLSRFNAKHLENRHGVTGLSDDDTQLSSTTNVQINCSLSGNGISATLPPQTISNMVTDANRNIRSWDLNGLLPGDYSCTLEVDGHSGEPECTETFTVRIWNHQSYKVAFASCTHLDVFGGVEGIQPNGVADDYAFPSSPTRSHPVNGDWAKLKDEIVSFDPDLFCIVDDFLYMSNRINTDATNPQDQTWWMPPSALTGAGTGVAVSLGNVNDVATHITNGTIDWSGSAENQNIAMRYEATLSRPEMWELTGNCPFEVMLGDHERPQDNWDFTWWGVGNPSNNSPIGTAGSSYLNLGVTFTDWIDHSGAMTATNTTFDPFVDEPNKTALMDAIVDVDAFCRTAFTTFFPVSPHTQIQGLSTTNTAPWIIRTHATSYDADNYTNLSKHIDHPACSVFLLDMYSSTDMLPLREHTDLFHSSVDNSLWDGMSGRSVESSFGTEANETAILNEVDTQVTAKKNVLLCLSQQIGVINANGATADANIPNLTKGNPDGLHVRDPNLHEYLADTFFPGLDYAVGIFSGNKHVPSGVLLTNAIDITAAALTSYTTTTTSGAILSADATQTPVKGTRITNAPSWDYNTAGYGRIRQPFGAYQVDNLGAQIWGTDNRGEYFVNPYELNTGGVKSLSTDTVRSLSVTVSNVATKTFKQYGVPVPSEVGINNPGVFMGFMGNASENSYGAGEGFPLMLDDNDVLQLKALGLAERFVSGRGGVTTELLFDHILSQATGFNENDTTTRPTGEVLPSTASITLTDVVDGTTYTLQSTSGWTKDNSSNAAPRMNSTPATENVFYHSAALTSGGITSAMAGIKGVYKAAAGTAIQFINLHTQMDNTATETYLTNTIASGDIFWYIDSNGYLTQTPELYSATGGYDDTNNRVPINETATISNGQSFLVIDPDYVWVQSTATANTLEHTASTALPAKNLSAAIQSACSNSLMELWVPATGLRAITTYTDSNTINFQTIKNAGMRSGSQVTDIAVGETVMLVAHVEIEVSIDDSGISSGGGFEILDTLNNDAAFNAIFAN